MLKWTCNLNGGVFPWHTQLVMNAFPAALAQQNALQVQFPKVMANMKSTRICAQSAVLARVFAR
jgi:hypothetical protein